MTKNIFPILFFAFFTGSHLIGQSLSGFEIRGLAIAAPQAEKVDSFVQFINEVLGPKGVNTLVLRVDYNFEYQSYPKLRDENPLTQSHIDKIKAACATYNMLIVPQINLLGHQSWHSTLENLLKEYPEFDETPHVQLPENYVWPNADGLYCKSYCPNHPGVHKVVFALVDELMQAFDTKAFHAGMDEVFYLADDKCPRCSGLDPATLFAEEVNRIRNHLYQRAGRLWIWGDRLIDGKATGIGMWEASMNNTHRAIDLIAKDVVICDWHYEKAHPVATLFASKGLDVITCPWRRPEVALQQIQMQQTFLKNSSKEMAQHFKGMMLTVWSPAQSFINQYYGKQTYNKEQGDVPGTFRAMFDKE